MTDDLGALRITVRRGSSVSDDPRTSIIVLASIDTSMVLRCLDSVREVVTEDDSVECIVVSNGMSRDSVAPLAARQDVVLISSLVNHGFSGGCNLAARFARGSELLFLNDDTTVCPGWLEGLRGALDRDATVAVAGSKVVLEDGRLQEAGSVLWRDGSTSGVGRGEDPASPDFADSRRVDYVSFCSALVRRCAWDEAGGFDERFFPAYYEDLDLCLALQRSGWSIVYEPTSVVRHREGGSASRDFRDFLSRRNQRAFVQKWSEVLRDYPTPPVRESQRPVAVRRARAVAERRPLPQRCERASVHAPPAPEHGLDDTEWLDLALRHLCAALTVQMDFTAELRNRLESRTMTDVIRHRLAPRKAAVLRLLRALR